MFELQVGLKPVLQARKSIQSSMKPDVAENSGISDQYAHEDTVPHILPGTYLLADVNHSKGPVYRRVPG